MIRWPFHWHVIHPQLNSIQLSDIWHCVCMHIVQLLLINHYQLCYTYSQENCPQSWPGMSNQSILSALAPYADKPTTRCTINKQCRHYVFVGAHNLPTLVVQTTPSAAAAAVDILHHQCSALWREWSVWPTRLNTHPEPFTSQRQPPTLLGWMYNLYRRSGNFRH
jgi:hypothetical protein